MDSESIEIRQEIARLLDEAVSSSQISLDRCRVRTPYIHYMNRPARYRNDSSRKSRPHLRTLDPIREDLCRVLERGLGHIAANPSRPGTTSALKALYTFPTTTRDTQRFDDWYGDVRKVNKDSQSPRKFVLLLARAAQANRALCVDHYLGNVAQERHLSTDRASLANESKWVLLGHKGVGKTIFLNYALSAYNELLHKKRTIWVRIDYTEETREGVELSDWIEWRICRTLFRWYDTEAREADKEKAGTDALGWQCWKDKTDKDMVFDLGPGNDTLYVRARLEDAKLTRKEFAHELRDAKVRIVNDKNPHKVKSWLFRAIWHHLVVDHRVGFIIVIDGLDRLGLSDADKDHFARKVREIQTEIRTDKALAAAYVITARHESYCLHLAGEQFEWFKLATVLPVSAEAVWEKRRAFLRDRTILPPERFEHVSAMGQPQYEGLQDLICDNLIKFATCALVSTWGGLEPDFDSSKGFALLESIFGENTRQLFSALGASARFLVTVLPSSFDALLDSAMAREESQWLQVNEGLTLTLRRDIGRELKGRWSYRFVEALMLQSTDNEFRRDRYRYAPKRKQPRGTRRFQLTVLSPDEFLYNVFRYAWAETVPQHRPCVLSSIRAAQYARSCGGIADRDSIVEFLVGHFGYLEDVVELVVDQLIEAGILRPYTGGESVSSFELQLTPRGEFTLDRLVNALEYVSLALQTSPLPSQLVEQNLFPVRPYTSETFVVDNKIVATINFLRLLSYLEDAEEKHFDKHVRVQTAPGAHEYSFRDFRGTDFRITDAMKGALSTALAKIVDRAFADGNAQQIAQLKDRFLTHPDKYFGIAEM